MPARNMLTRIATLAFVALAGPALAQTKIVLGQVSRTTTNWPFYVAEAKGFFKPEKLDIQYEYIGNVSNLGQQIVGGSLDVGVTTFEVNLQLGELGAPISMIGATAIKYAYSMMARKEITKPADLKGKKVAVPVPKADIANFFDMWLKANGMTSADVDIVYDGASTNRYAALVAGAVSAAAMSPPLDFAASDAGYVKLIDFGQFVKAYGFLAVTARKDWLAKNRPTAEALMRGLSKATDWLYDPANKAEAVALLMQETKQTREISEKTYDYIVTDLQAFSRKLDIPDADFNNVLKSFQELGIVKSRDATKARYVDLSFLGK